MAVKWNGKLQKSLLKKERNNKGEPKCKKSKMCKNILILNILNEIDDLIKIKILLTKNCNKRKHLK